MIGGYGRDQNGLRHTSLRFAEVRDITRHFTATGGVTDMNGIAQVELFENGRGIGSIVVEIVTFAHLLRAAMATAVMGDHAVAVQEEEQHLRVPVV